MSFTVLMRMPIQPGLDKEKVDEVLHHDLPNTASFAGNEGTEVIAEEGDTDGLYLLTRWTSREHYETYSAWRRSPEGATRLAEISSGPPTVTLFTSYIRF